MPLFYRSVVPASSKIQLAGHLGIAKAVITWYYACMDARQKSMSLLDWGLNARELSHARSVLQDDEQVVLVLRPQVEADGELRWQSIAFLCLFAFVVALAQLAGGHPLSFLAGVLLCVPGGCVMFRRWRKQYCRRHSFYMLTRQRALVMAASIRRFHTRSYPLHEGMVEAVAVRGDGSGNIVFGERKDWYINKRVIDEVQQLGFMDIPQVKHVRQVLEQVIQEQVNAGK
jgi:hypothetical protein